MSPAAEAAQSDRELERRRTDSALTRESTVPDTSASSLGGVLNALGADGSDDANSRLMSSPIMRHGAGGEVRALAMRRVQQGVGNHKAQQLVAQLRRPSFIQRECSCGGTCSACQSKELEEEQEPKLLQRQTAEAGAGPSVADEDIIPTDSPGHPLDHSTRNFMESRFGTDFSDVRVHTDHRAAGSAKTLQADAYTTGRDIYFAAGKYAPASRDGQKLLAHELTHTVQQAEGRLARSAFAAKGDAVVASTDDPLENEAEEAAEKVVSSKTPAGDSSAPAVTKSVEEGVLQDPATKPDKSAAPFVEPANTAAPEPRSTAAGPSSGSALGETSAAAPAPSLVKERSVPPKAPLPPPLVMPSIQTFGIPVTESPVDLTDSVTAALQPAPEPETQETDLEATAAEIESLLGQLRTKADARKEEIRADAVGVKSRLTESGAAQQAAVRSKVADSLTVVTKQIADIRSDASNEAMKVKASATMATSTGQLGVLLKTATQAKAIEASAQAHKKQATAAVAAEREAVRKFGADEGKRGKDLIEKQAQDAIAKGQAKGAGYPTDERGQAQAEAVLKVASEMASKLREPGPELQSSVTSSGKELAEGIASMDKEFAKSVDEQTPKITGDLFTQAKGLEKHFTAIRTNVARGVDDVVVDINQKLDEVENAASTELQAAEALVVGQIEASVLQIQAMVDAETEAAINAIEGHVIATSQAAKRTRRSQVRVVRSTIAEADAMLEGMAQQFTDGLEEVADTGSKGFAEAGDKVGSSISAIAANVGSSVATIGAPAQLVFETLGKKAEQGCEQINTQWEKSLEGVQKAVDAKYDEAITAMVKEIEKNLVTGKNKITAQVNEAVAKNREPLDQLDSKMEEAAKEARDKYDAPWYKKVGRWVLHALWSFLTAVGKFLLVVLAIVVVVIVLIVGIVFDIVALIVLAVIALVAGVVWMLYGILKGWWDRVMSAETWWEAAWAGMVGILDIVGIPGVIEGIIQHDIVNGRKLSVEEAGDRFGTGLFGLLMWILPAKLKAGRAAKAPRVRTEIPIERPPVSTEPVKPLAPPEPVKAVPAPEGASPEPAPGEAPKPTPSPEVPEPSEPAPEARKGTEEAGAKAEDTTTKGEVSKEELAQAKEDLQQRVRKPENIRRVSDPELSKKYDAEVDVEGHTYRRRIEDGSWCLFSSTPRGCGPVGDAVNKTTDEALGKAPKAEPQELRTLAETPSRPPDAMALRQKYAKELEPGQIEISGEVKATHLADLRTKAQGALSELEKADKEASQLEREAAGDPNPDLSWKALEAREKAYKAGQIAEDNLRELKKETDLLQRFESDFERALYRGRSPAEITKMQALLKRWNKGTYSTAEESIFRHAERHGYSLEKGELRYMRYLEDAQKFYVDHCKGTKPSRLSSEGGVGTGIYRHGGRYLIVDANDNFVVYDSGK